MEKFGQPILIGRCQGAVGDIMLIYRSTLFHWLFSTQY